MPTPVHMQYKSTVTPTQKLHTIGQNQSMLSLNCLILNGTKEVIDRQSAMLFHNRKTNKAACGLHALEVYTCWWVFQS